MCTWSSWEGLPWATPCLRGRVAPASRFLGAGVPHSRPGGAPSGDARHWPPAGRLHANASTPRHGHGLLQLERNAPRRPPPRPRALPARTALFAAWSPRREARCVAVLLLLLLFLHLLLPPAAMAQMPYTPTHLLRHDHRLYIFQPASPPSTQAQLRALDLSVPVSAANVPYTTLAPSLPFLDSTAARAFTPVVDARGNLTVYTGDCAQGAAGGQVWTYAPDAILHSDAGTWSREAVAVQDSPHRTAMGANFLSTGVAFSSTVGGDAASTGAYVFGGMCPNQTDTTGDWQAAATYSNLMVTLQPTGTHDNAVNYSLGLSPGRGPPIPEAGFTMTGLSPTFSNRTDGSQTQQQNFVLLGGHTDSAFINMSQIALFSLPEQGWTFIGVQPPDTSRTDLAIRADVTAVDPRSGHTAVLTPDGQQLVVMGGWVGDIHTPATPQYAVLNVADGYGGQGNWRWTVPTTAGGGLPDGTGLYGHGAAMLPGGMLMVTGGYSIPAPGSRRRRATTPTPNTKAYFLNVTSNTWTATYTPLIDISPTEPADSGPLSTPAQKAGLGVGLGMGVAAVCGLFAFYMWYTRRLKKQRQVREKQLQDLSFTAQRYNVDDYPPGLDGGDDGSDAFDCPAVQPGSYYFPQGAQGGQGWRAFHGGDAERTGLLVEIPSPTRGLRRSLIGKPAYAVGRARGSGQIHPIDELEEEPDEGRVRGSAPSPRQAEMVETRHCQGASLALDPFTDIQGRSGGQRGVFYSVFATPTAQALTQPIRSSSDHILGVGDAQEQCSPTLGETLLPDKSSSERTGSNLSERSTRSDLSWTSSGAGVMRSSSMCSMAMLNNVAPGNPFNTPSGSPTQDKPYRETETGRISPVDPRTRSLTSNRSIGTGETDVFYPARSSFPHLQAEGEALLGGNPELPRPRPSSSQSNSNHDIDTSHSRIATVPPATLYALDLSAASRPVTRERRRSWLGSVRRVLTRSASGAERTRSLTIAASQHEPYKDTPVFPVEKRETGTRMSLPAADTSPRRAASDASFWRNRRGKQDWLEDEQDPTWRRNAGDDWGAPEDVAMAKRERQRQEWRERGTRLVNIDNGDQRLPTPRTPIGPDHLGVEAPEDRPCTPASEADWDVEAAVERRVVQVMFTVPKSKLRVVNADVDESSILSLPYDSPGKDGEKSRDETGSPSGRVKNLAGRFEQMNNSNSTRSSPRPSPRPSPSPSIKSTKTRANPTTTLVGEQGLSKGDGTSRLTKEL